MAKHIIDLDLHAYIITEIVILLELAVVHRLRLNVIQMETTTQIRLLRL